MASHFYPNLFISSGPLLYWPQGYQKHSLRTYLYSPSPTLPRPKKDGTATGMDFVCTHQLDSVGPGLDKKWLYWELSQLTHGITQLGPYTLDQDSFYINGEGLPFFFFFFLHHNRSHILPLYCSISLIPPLSQSICFTCAGYTHQTQTTTPSGEYSETSGIFTIM